MAWEKVVRIVCSSSCPKCGHNGFSYKPHPTGDEFRPDDKMTCGACGYVCTEAEAGEAGKLKRSS